MKRFHFQTIGSTNSEAQRLSTLHLGEAIVVSADEQTAGRGRTSRAWSSPAGGAWFSLALPAPPGGGDVFRPMPLLVGLAVLEEIERLLPEAGRHTLSLKWPNDVLLDGQKVAGVLCERCVPGGPLPLAGATLIVGVGVNLNCTRAQIGADLRFPATSVREATGGDCDVGAFVERCAARVLAAAGSLATGGLSRELLGAIESRLAWVGESVSIKRGEETLVGVCLGLDDAGHFRLRVGDETTSLDAGEVFGLTPLKAEHVLPEIPTMHATRDTIAVRVSPR